MQVVLFTRAKYRVEIEFLIEYFKALSQMCKKSFVYQGDLFARETFSLFVLERRCGTLGIKCLLLSADERRHTDKFGFFL